MLKILHLVLKTLALLSISYSIYYISNQKENLKFLGYFIIPNEIEFGVLSFPSLIFMILTLSGCSLLLFSLFDIIFTFRSIFISNDKLNMQLIRIKKKMKKMCEGYYQEGVQGIYKVVKINKLPNPWKMAIRNLEIKLPIEDIESLLQFNKDIFEKKISNAISICSILSSLAPSIGIMGTVVGLIQLLANLKDPSTIGPNMSVAMMTTLYGIILGNICLSPITRRLISIKQNSLEIYENLEFWLEIIREKKPSFYSEQNYQKYQKNP